MGSKEWNDANKEKVCEYKRKHYLKNKEVIIERAQKWKNENREKCRKYVESIKENGHCLMCGFEHPGALVFHHRDNEIKEECIANIRDRSFEFLKKEIDKCDLLCANCHSILHYEIRNGNKFVL